MDALVSLIMGNSTAFDIYVAIRLAVIFAIIDMLRGIVVELIKGVKP